MPMADVLSHTPEFKPSRLHGFTSTEKHQSDLHVTRQLIAKEKRYPSRADETFQTDPLVLATELKYGSIAFSSKQNPLQLELQDKLGSSWKVVVNAGPACPIRFTTPDNHNESLADQCLTAAEIEWRRWSGWQMERTAEKRFRKQWA